MAPAIYHPPILIQVPIAQFEEQGTSNVYQSNWIDSPFDWNELIVSWNLKGTNSSLIVEVRVRKSGEMSPWFCLGQWDSAVNSLARTSVNGQTNSWGIVNTDTLHLNGTGGDVQIQLTTPNFQSLKLVTASFSNVGHFGQDTDPNHAAWGVHIEVPKRCQLNYPNGNVVCSATSTSMLLDYWSRRTGNLSLDQDVPIVASHVYDNAWNGTGNWPFNMAFAGSLPGMTAYVTRFDSIRQLEDLIAFGIPVACSVSYKLLMGQPKGSDDGHLVVLVGFTKTGDPIFNDPAVSRETTTVYHRKDFVKGWADSGQTVYLVYPENEKLPSSHSTEWLSK